MLAHQSVILSVGRLGLLLHCVVFSLAVTQFYREQQRCTTKQWYNDQCENINTCQVVNIAPLTERISVPTLFHDPRDHFP